MTHFENVEEAVAGLVPVMAAYIKATLDADRQKRRGDGQARGEPNFGGSAPGSQLRTTLSAAVRKAEELAKE